MIYKKDEYTIEIQYSTGDSFGIYDETRTIEFTFKNLDTGKAILQRIKEHYQYWYAQEYAYHKEVPSKPDWIKKGDSESTIRFLLDDGKEVQMCPFWIGYFNRLYGAEIVNVKEEDTKLEF